MHSLPSENRSNCSLCAEENKKKTSHVELLSLLLPSVGIKCVADRYCVWEPSSSTNLPRPRTRSQEGRASMSPWTSDWLSLKILWWRLRGDSACGHYAYPARAPSADVQSRLPCAMSCAVPAPSNSRQRLHRWN